MRGVTPVHGVAWAGPVGADRWLIRINESFAATRVDGIRVRNEQMLQFMPKSRTYIVTFGKPPTLVVLDGRNPHAESVMSPTWMDLHGVADDAYAVSGLAAGWPLRCLSAGAIGPATSTTNGTQAMVYGAIRFRALEPNQHQLARTVRGAMPTTPDIGATMRGVLPIQPIWGGLLANSLCFGSLVGVIWGGSRAILHAFRSRKGLCPACGYNLAGMPAPGCPECGRGRDATAMSLGARVAADAPNLRE